MTKQRTKWIELNDWQIVAIEEALRNGLSCADKASVDNLVELITKAKKIKVSC